MFIINNEEENIPEVVDEDILEEEVREDKSEAKINDILNTNPEDVQISLQANIEEVSAPQILRFLGVKKMRKSQFW